MVSVPYKVINPSIPVLPCWFFACTEIDGAGTGTLANYKELTRGLPDSGRQRVGTEVCEAGLELQPHFVGGFKPKLFIEVPALGGWHAN